LANLVFHVWKEFLMSLRWIPWAGLVLLLSAGAARTDEAPARTKAPAAKEKPTFALRVRSLDELLAAARYLAARAGRAELARQGEKMLKERITPKGLAGVDTKKPIGLYGTVKDRLPSSEVVLMVPIADQKAFLAMLKELDLEPQKGKDGLYTVEAEGIRFPVLFRFANGYLYGTLKVREKAALAALAKDKLPLPADVLPRARGELLALALNLDAVPEQIRGLMLSASELLLSNAKDEEVPGASAALKQLRESTLDEMSLKLKSLLDDGQAVTLRLNVDRKAHEIGVVARLDGKPGSDLVKGFAALSPARSIAGSFAARDSALRGTLALNFPEAVRKALAPVIDEEVKKRVNAEKNKDRRALLAELLGALKPTLKAAVLDAGFDLRGPGKGGKYTLVVGAQVKGGDGIEKAVKKVLVKLPAAVSDLVELDADKASAANIHRVTLPPERIDKRTKELLGDGPFYFALRKDALLIGLGEQGLPALKEALAVKPAAGRPLSVELSLARLPQVLPRVARLLKKEPKQVRAAAEKAFKDKDGDKVRLSVEGGKSLEVRLSVSSQVVKFLGLLIGKVEEDD
jgi:hypothetical protein